MAGRFPLYTDADVHGPIIEGLRRSGWDIARAVDLYPEGEADVVHFERAARDGRVLVSNDLDQVLLAQAWIAAGREFRGFITWQKADEDRMTVGDFLRAFESLAQQENPFSPYPIVRIKPTAP